MSGLDSFDRLWSGASAGRVLPWGVALVAAVACLLYANTLGHGFVVDDHYQILDNPWIEGPRHLPEVFSSGVWDFEGRPGAYYRPTMYVLYMLVHGLVGLSAPGYHLLNLLLHAGASVLVVLFTRLLLERDRHDRSAAVAAVTAGLLFACHPVHTEAVAWSAGVADLSATFFVLLGYWLYLRAVRDGSIASAVLSGLALLVAMLGKEPATLAVVPIGVHLALTASARAVPRSTGGAVVGSSATALAIYTALRVNALGGIAPQGGESPGLGLWASLVTSVDLLGRYLRTLVVPYPLNFWHVYTVPEGGISFRLSLGVGIVAAFLAIGLAAWRKRSRGGLVGWTLLAATLLPALYVPGLNQGIENAFTERYLYLPSVGLVVLLAAWLARADGWPRAKRVTIAVTTALALIVFSAATVLRNRVWNDSLSLWADVIQKSETSAIAQMNYGLALLHAGREVEGREHLTRASRLDPTLVDREVSKAIVNAQRGRMKRAVLTFHTALMLDPSRAATHYNLALAYEALGWTAEAMNEYRNAIRLDDRYADAYNNLGILTAASGRIRESVPYFRRAVELDPGDPEFRANLSRAMAALDGDDP